MKDFQVPALCILLMVYSAIMDMDSSPGMSLTVHAVCFILECALGVGAGILSARIGMRISNLENRSR